MTHILQDLDVIQYFDDVLIGGKSEDKLLNKTKRLLKRFNENGLTINCQKCDWFETPELSGYRARWRDVKPLPQSVAGRCDDCLVLWGSAVLGGAACLVMRVKRPFFCGFGSMLTHLHKDVLSHAHT